VPACDDSQKLSGSPRRSAQMPTTRGEASTPSRSSRAAQLDDTLPRLPGERTAPPRRERPEVGTLEDRTRGRRAQWVNMSLKVTRMPSVEHPGRAREGAQQYGEPQYGGLTKGPRKKVACRWDARTGVILSRTLSQR
jgi:hypothetical protein